MDTGTFNQFRKIVYEHSGISLSEAKQALVAARIGRRLRELKLSDEKVYLKYLAEDTSGEELISLIDVISTNTTHFFREPTHFDQMGKLMNEWISQGQTRFRIWCAAASTGEEPYTLAMTVLEAAKDKKLDIKILATDISTSVLEKCHEGLYEEEKLEGVSNHLTRRYFTQEKTQEGIYYRAKEEMRNILVFKRLNLAAPPFPMKGPFDIIFCRNVMIYFDNIVRANLIAEFERLLKPGGPLMIAHAESLSSINTNFKLIGDATYIKP